MSFYQTKTTKGFIPFDRVSLGGFSIGETKRSSNASLHFNLIAPEVWAQVAEKDGNVGDFLRDVDLTHLAATVRIKDGAATSNDSDLLEIAGKTGPLFGDDSGEEVLRSWSNAAYVAALACRIQECLNGRKAISSLSSLMSTDKLQVFYPDGTLAFSLVEAGLYSVPELQGLFKSLPLIRRTVLDGCYEYSIAFRATEEGSLPTVCVAVVSLDRELTHDEFEYLIDQLKIDPVSSSALYDRVEMTKTDSVGGDLGLYGKSEQMDESDLRALEALLQIMIVIHFDGVKVDMFLGDESTGFLSFDSVLSWLWYQFARDREDAAIGYCVLCGKPFSLRGHRGEERKYCSAACKNRAKNLRSSGGRDRARTLFMKGMSVREIAKTLGTSDAKGEERIRGYLSSWPKLKGEVESEIAELGFRGSKLLRRCQEEQLDIDKLLNAKRAKELKQLFGDPLHRQE